MIMRRRRRKRRRTGRLQPRVDRGLELQVTESEVCLVLEQLVLVDVGPEDVNWPITLDCKH